MTGVLIGSYIFGDLSDRYGRRPTFFISLVLQLIGGLLAAIAPEYITFILARILIGASTSGVFLVAYVIGSHININGCILRANANYAQRNDSFQTDIHDVNNIFVKIMKQANCFL